jgi:RNA polymerase sigma-70 factor, ECF subfamily
MQPYQPTDENLLLAIQRGERVAVAPLVERHHSPLIGYLYRLTGGDRALAEDLAQETFLRLISTVQRYAYPRPVKPYLYQIATNLARDHFKSASVRHAAPLSESHPADEWVEQSVLTGLAARDAASALAELPSVQRETVLLRYFQDLSLNEIAELLGIPVGTVKSRLSLGLKRLRERLSPESIDHEVEHESSRK